MTQPFSYPTYLKSRRWQEKKKKVFGGRRWECSVCKRGGKLIIHHRSYRSIGNESPSDLTRVCPTCHYNIHHDIHGKVPLTGNALIARERVLRGRMKRFWWRWYYLTPNDLLKDFAQWYRV